MTVHTVPEMIALVCEVCGDVKPVKPRSFEEWAHTAEYRLMVEDSKKRNEVRRKMTKAERELDADLLRAAMRKQWSLLSAGRFGRDVLVCGKPDCGMKARETMTPPEMIAENPRWRIGDYLETFNPDHYLPKKIIYWSGWPPSKERIEAENRKSVRTPYIYLAGPLLGAGEPASQNVAAAIKDAMRLADAGYVPFVPHLYFFADMVDPHPLDYWYRLDRAWMEKCSALVRRPGQSAGSDLEEVWANELRIPIWYGVEAFLADMPEVLSQR